MRSITPTLPASPSSRVSLLVSHVPFEPSDDKLANSISDMLSGPICAMVWEGKDAVKTGRSKFPRDTLGPPEANHALLCSYPGCH